MEKFVAQSSFDGATINTIDGLRADFSDGWGLVRASNTTPALVVRFEADSDDAIAKIQNAFSQAMKAVDKSIEIPF